ncbi:hypothetical protein AURDEDRAFT_182313 [Auricularia subglabra TFB-10046 SS5]|nr:hypothetical protein AURDEDRAFT_182313 [Auricularia subglabra TFB-10046 SS5]
MSLFPAAVRAHVAFNTRVMQEHAERDAQLTQDLARTHRALATAHAEVAALQAERARVQSRLRAMQRETQQLILSWHMQTLPNEILRMIFVQFRVLTGAWEPTLTQWSACRDIMRVPFTLAAVCRAWRVVALDFSALWAFVCPPPMTVILASPRSGTLRPYIHPGHQEACLACVQLLLQRSRDLTLDIVYLSHNDDALALLASDAQRWRSFTYAAPTHSHGSMLIFRHPLKELLHLVIVSLPDRSALLPTKTAGYPLYLPAAPKLSLLWSMDSNFLLLGQRQPLNTLIVLDLRVHELPLRVVLEMLRLVPRLLHLRIEVSSILDEHLPPSARPSPVRFAYLKYLALWPAPDIDPQLWTDMLDTPGVPDFRTYSSTFPEISPFVGRIAATLEELHLESGDLDSDVLDDFAELKKLRILYLSHATISDEFFEGLAEDPSLLPMMSSLTIDGSSNIEPSHGEGLIHLIQARKSTSSQSPADTTARLSTVVLTSSNIPFWLKSQVEYLYRDGRKTAWP